MSGADGSCGARTSVPPRDGLPDLDGVDGGAEPDDHQQRGRGRRRGERREPPYREDHTDAGGSYRSLGRSV